MHLCNPLCARCQILAAAAPSNDRDRPGIPPRPHVAARRAAKARRPIVERVLDHLAPQAQARRAYPEPLPPTRPWARVDLAWAPLEALR